ncbi:MAG: LON peptidase substrate-binding domain-containing protein, partial [Acidimicrobiales bacterium]
MTNPTEPQTLPLLPLSSGVVLPGMVFTLALETDEARTAAEAAGAVGGRLVIVPHIEGRYSPIGVVSEIVELGELPGGAQAAVIRGLERGTIGTGLPGTGRALWVQVDPLVAEAASSEAHELA